MSFYLVNHIFALLKVRKNIFKPTIMLISLNKKVFLKELDFFKLILKQKTY